MNIEGKGLNKVKYLVCYANLANKAESESEYVQHPLDRLAAEGEAAGMRISTAESDTMTLSRKPVNGVLSPIEGVLSRGNAHLLRKESVEVLRASGKDAHWAPPLVGVPGTTSWEET